MSLLILCRGETGGKCRGNVCTGGVATAQGAVELALSVFSVVAMQRGPCVLGKAGPGNGPVL